MWAIRTYKDMDEKKVIGYGIVDEVSLEYHEYGYDQLRALLISKSISVYNLEVVSYKIRMKNYNPKQKTKYFRMYQADTEIFVYDYCIITGFRMGMLSGIAISPELNGIVSVTDVTLGELASRIGAESIDKLRLYNAHIMKEQNEYRVYVYNHNTDSYVKMPRLNTDRNVSMLMDNEKIAKIWKYEGTKLAQEGASVDYIERREGAYQDTIPEIFARIKRFGGGVNKLILPSQIIQLASHCFEGLEDLKELVIKANLEVIPPCCCKDSSIKRIAFSGTEKSIGNEAFYDCFSLAGSIVTNAEIVGKKAFAYTAITSLVLLKAKTIEEGAFENDTKLAKVRLSEGLETIKANAFKNCKQLTSIDIPSSVVMIEAGAFAGCNKLGTVRLPKQTMYSEKAFPKNVTVRRVPYK